MSKFILGVEEAGRGPVIGPMIISGVLVQENRIEELVTEGVRDSKLLKPEKRRELFKIIQQISDGVLIKVLDPLEIDNRFTKNLNLNDLEGVKMSELINEFKPNKAIIDCPSTNERAFQEFIRNRLDDKNVELIVEHKADMNYPVVSAASIISKVVRDEEMKKLQAKLGVNLGSGYPSDPNTQKFLKANISKLNSLPFIRKSWATVNNLINIQKQKSVKDWL